MNTRKVTTINQLRKEQAHINSLRKKFPAIDEALARLNADWTEELRKDRLYIAVEQASENLLQVSPELCDGKLCSLRSTESWNEDLGGWRHEIIYAVDGAHEIIGELGALRPEKDRRDSRQIKHLVARTVTKLRYLVRLTVTGWCQLVKNRKYLHEDALGELMNRHVLVTVYKAPRKSSFAQLLNNVSSDASLRLHFGAALFGVNTDDPNVLGFLMNLQVGATRFEDRVLNNGFSTGLTDAKELTGKLGPVDFKAENWRNCSSKLKLNLELSLGNTRLSFVAEDGHLGLQGAYATVAEALYLLDQAIAGWEEKLSGVVQKAS